MDSADDQQRLSHSAIREPTGSGDFFDALFMTTQDNGSRVGNDSSSSATSNYPAPSAHRLPPSLQDHPPAVSFMNSLPLDSGFDFLNVIMSQPANPNYNPQVLLEQRLKLNQLQQLQLQNQIIQQQLEMLNGQATSSMDVDRHKQSGPYVGLPTPLNSTEIHAQQSTEFVSPMTLSYIDTTQLRSDSQTSLPPPDLPLPSHQHLLGTHSAPANIVFNTSPPVPLPSPSDLNDFDLSPLTSPWIEAHNNRENAPSHTVSRLGAASSGKRTASPNDEEAIRYGRSRLSPANQTSQARPSIRRGTKSASSTPLMRSTRSGGRKGGTPSASALDTIVGDSPSPVDLSMPPPAPPEFVSTTALPPSDEGRLDPSSLNMTPVTPASMMNLRRLNVQSNLAPPPGQPTAAQTGAKTDNTTAKTARRRSSTASASTNPAPISKNVDRAPAASPGLKPILPAGGISNQGSSTLVQSALAAVLMPRKTSHKAAEQKRRDSLKTTFDELRGLLPPIPLPTEDGFGDEPVLPGAMPPRGPPRGNADGPNRGISKLQLLRCGNEYIRLLKGQVTRRDHEMERLRREVARLRVAVGGDTWQEGGEEVELDRDVDEGVDLGPWKRAGSAAEEGIEDDVAD